MSTTIFGSAGGTDQVAVHHHRSGSFADAHTYRELDLELPAGGVPVDLDHGGEIVGRLVYGELANSGTGPMGIGFTGTLNVVCVLDGDEIESIDQPVYLSTRTLLWGAGHRTAAVAAVAELLALGLTLEPADLGARPIEHTPGDIRDAGDRGRWPMSWRTEHPLHARAAEHLSGTRTRSATRLVRNPEIIKLNERVMLVDDELVSTSPPNRSSYIDEDGVPRGPMHYARGTILRVS